VQKGENFYDLAKKYSEDEGSAQNGGDVGWTKRNFLDKDYETVAFGQKEGEISEPIRTRFGYHIVRTVKKKDLSLHVRLIEFKVPISDAELAKARAALEEAYKQARAGTELKTLAQRFADNPDGLFIYSEPYDVRKNMLVPELAVQIEKMGEGGITDIIERDKEYYFVRLIKKD
jgi:parvulin-like peptidyl-prolyl isomerase